MLTLTSDRANQPLQQWFLSLSTGLLSVSATKHVQGLGPREDIAKQSIGLVVNSDNFRTVLIIHYSLLVTTHRAQCTWITMG